MRYLKFYLEVVVPFVLACITLLLLLLYIIYQVEFKHKESYLAAAIDKVKLLKTTRGPKIVLVGASNIAFGIDSSKVMQTFGVPVVNLGLHGNVGTKIFIELSKKHTNPGDIVVFSPEYGTFYDDRYYGRLELIYVLHSCPELMESMASFRQYRVLTTYAGQYIYKILSECLDETKAGKSEVYKRTGFNMYGDLVSHLDKKSTFSHDHPLPKVFRLNDYVFEDLIRFKYYLKANNIKFVTIHPSYSKTLYEKMPEFHVVNDLLSKKNMGLVSTVYVHLFDDEYIYDFPYHLNKDGRIIRTNSLITEMSKVLVPNPEVNTHFSSGLVQ